MSLDLYSDELQRSNRAGGVAGNVEPGLFEGFVRGTGMFAMKEFAKTARSVSMAGASIPVAIDAITGGTTLQDKYFKSHEDTFGSAVKFWDPDPGTVGEAGQIAGSLIGLLPQIIANPAAAVASQQLSSAEDLVVKPGVSSGKAMAVGAAQALGLGVGIWAPPALGYNLASKAATGAGVNWLQGVLTRGASSAILGDNPVAKNYEPFGAKDQAIDVLLGLVFGAASQYVPSWKAEAEARTDQVNVPAQRAIAGEIGQTTAFDLGVAAARVNKGFADDRAARLKEWADSATPTQKAGLAVARLSHHMQVDSAPGRATSPGAANDHVVRLREAIDSLVRDGIVPPETTVPRETLDQFVTRAGEEIGGVSHLTGIVQTLQRVYIEQGPEAGRAMLDEAAANAPGSSGFEEQVATPGFIDELHGELTARAQEFQEKQQPAFVPDPEREAFAIEQTRAMQEAATRIAREEGLPEGPSILLPIADQLKAHFMETGYRKADGTWHKMDQAEADEYIAKFAALDAVNFKAFAGLTGGKMTPEQLLHRYLADVKMRAPAPAGALEQRMTPAQHIADYKPTVETSQYGGTRYRNEYLELGNSTATNSKGQKGERRSFEIMDKSGGTATTVGFVIVEIDSKGKFAALRNIEIRSDIRTKGLGENVVATLVAHNGRGYQMDIVDITHGGHVGTDGDALPFWKKVGTQLKNYSRDPNVQMDGMLSLEDYLGARSGQGLAEGRRGSAAQAVPANRAGAGTAGSGMSRGGPTAADRAELARLNSLEQRAGHMSPHTFSRFDHSHMSGGEGAQVYGWGTYLFTKKEVGDWYYNNFQRKAEQEARITLVDQDAAKAWIDGNLPDAVIPAAQEYIKQRTNGVDKDAAANWALALWDEAYTGDSADMMAKRMSFNGALEHIDDLAVKTLTSRDDPAYKTPDGQVVHASQTGQKKALASAIGQVAHEGYARAALTFDRLIETTKGSAEYQNKELQFLIDAETAEINSPTLEAFQSSEIGKSQWGAVAPNDADWTIMDGGSVRGHSSGSDAADAIDTYREERTFAIDRWKETQAANNQRVTELKRQRALVDEITEAPAAELLEKSVSKFGFEQRTYLLNDQKASTVSMHQTQGAGWNYEVGGTGIWRHGFDTAEEALDHARGMNRTLKPGYEVVKPTPKPVRKYTVEAPENDVLLNWEVSAGEQPQKVKDALAKQGVLIPDESGILFNARIAREIDEDYIASNDMLSEEDRQADLLALPNEDSSYYREKAIQILQDEMGDSGRLVIDPQATGRQVYVELMKMVGYDPGRDGSRLDGKNTQYAAAASQMLAEAGIPGHRYYDGNSRSGRKRDQTYNFVIYDENAIDIVHMEQDQTRGYLNIGENREMTMGFLQATDPSTPIHERAHFFLEMLDDLSREFPAAEAEMQVLFKDWGVDRQTWDSWSLDDKRFYHEQFARSWEAYLMSNKAPTPELRSVFRRFRDWLVAIYESAQTLNVKVSTEMRELFDRLHGSQQLDPSTDPAAKAAASGPPPPPQPGVESQRPPGTVDPFADMPTETQSFVPRTMDDQDMREHLRYMVDNELGWAQIGGKNLGGMNGVPNFSTWIPRAEWWALRPDNVKKLKEQEYEAAVAKALVGDKLKPIEQRAVDFMMHVANERMQAEQAIGRDEWNNIAKELTETDLEPTTKNVVDADAVAIANQIDEGMVERLAIQYDADDAGFMAEIRRMIDDHQNPEAAAGSQEAVGQAPEGVPTARSAAQPGPEASAKAAGSDGVDLLAQEADRFVADNPDLTLEFEMPDGSTQKMTAAEYLADVRESAAMAREDIKLIHEAAQCLLGAS